MITILILQRTDCNTEELLTQFLDKVKNYIGTRSLEQTVDFHCPVLYVTTDLSPEEKVEIRSFASSDYQEIIFYDGKLKFDDSKVTEIQFVKDLSKVAIPKGRIIQQSDP